jgi:serine/threonine-protein kinase
MAGVTTIGVGNLPLQTPDSDLKSPLQLVGAGLLTSRATTAVHYAFPMIGSRIAHYRIEEELGRGGMGVVYRARDTKLNRDVAIKTLSPALSPDSSSLSRIQREAQLLAALNHSNIGSIYGLEEHAGAVHLVLEFVPGETLEGILKRKRFSVREALLICSQICEALEAAHEKGIIHRDLKPGNIKVTPEGRVKVLDFGLAKMTGIGTGQQVSQEVTADGAQTLEGTVLGTVAYMSPEQARAQTLDRRTDIWAFGVVLFEMLSGRHPFLGKTRADTIAAIVEKDPEWSALPPETPAGLQRLLQRCLQKEASRRLRDVGDARIEIEEAANLSKSGFSAADSFATPGKVAPPVWQRFLPWGLSLAALAFALWTIWNRTPPMAEASRHSIHLTDTEGLAELQQPALAISPDGSRIVYVASRSGVSRLFLKMANDFEPHEIPNTEGAYNPFFSPDGKSLVFFVSRSLKTLSLLDGRQKQVTRVPPIHCGASWAPDGTMITTWTWANEGLRQVSAAGGEQEILTVPDPNLGEVGHCWPEVLPGGNHILFTVMTRGGPEQFRIAVLSRETRKWRTVLEGGSNPHYLSSGHLLFLRAGKALAAPFDLGKLELTGPAVPVIENVEADSFNGAGQFAVSETGTLVYADATARETTRQVVWVNRNGQWEPMKIPLRAYNTPSLSPDGSRLVLSVDAANPDLWVFDLNRGTLSRLTTHPAYDEYPVWFPDGRRIAFSSNRRAGAHDLYSVAADGSSREEMLSARAAAETPHFGGSISPDGRWLAFSEDWITGKATGWDIHMLPLEGPRQARAFLESAFDETQPVFSPDGKWLAYVSNESGRDEVCVQAFPGPAKKIQISTQGGQEPRWSREGKELFYRSGDSLMVVDVNLSPDLKAGPPRKLFDGKFMRTGTNPGIQQFDVAPGGRRFVMILNVGEAGPSQIRVVQNWFSELRQQTPSGSPNRP